MVRNNSEEINFQHYVDLVKQNQFPWNIFIDVMQDLSYSDVNKIRNLNTILLKELTMDYSEIDRLKYLNDILLIEFKNYVQQSQNFDMTLNNYCKKSVDLNVHEETNDEFEDNLPKKEETETDTSYTNSKMVESNDHVDGKLEDDSISLPTEQITETNPNEIYMKTFLCHICNKEFHMNFQLKQHIRKFHEEKRTNSVQITIDDNQVLDEHEIATDKKDNSIFDENNINKHVQVILADYKDHKCNFCNKSFSQEGSLKMHIHLIHENDNYYRCETCDKSFSNARNLKRHIHTVHKDNE